MIYECLIHFSSLKFCVARTREQSRTSQPWGAGEAVFENGKWSGIGDFMLDEVDIDPEGMIDFQVLLAGGTVPVMASQIRGA